jgi:integrase
MPRLSDRAAVALKPRAQTYRVIDGGGLMLKVRPNGNRNWQFRYMLDGRRRDMGLGRYPDVSLAQARRLSAEARALTAVKKDPIAARDRARAELAEQERAARSVRVRTFRDAAEALVASQSPGWSSAKTLASWRLTLDTYAHPTLGDRPVAEVARDEVLDVLRPLWTSRPPTALKLQRRIAAVLDYAQANGWRSTENPASSRLLRLTRALPARPPSRRQPSLPWSRVPAFLSALARRDGSAPLALRFAILTAMRSAEVRHARWDEFDLAARVWTLAPQRLKGGRRRGLAAHRVPLTDAMLVTLARAAALATGEVEPVSRLQARVRLLGDALVFPSPSGKALSDMALSACVKRMNEDLPTGTPQPWRDSDGRPAVPHGFRRSFRTWVDDTCPQHGEAAERALAHEEASPVRAAYRGSDMLEQRRILMVAWNGYCTGEDRADATRDHIALRPGA